MVKGLRSGLKLPKLESEANMLKIQIVQKAEGLESYLECGSFKGLHSSLSL